MEDVLDILDLDARIADKLAQTKDVPRVETTSEEREILEYLGWEARRIDQIVPAVEFAASDVASLLTLLELKGLVKQDIGGNYLRIR